MSDTVLSGRWVVKYSVENREKRIYRDTSVTPTVTDDINDLYSALQDLFDELTQMDDGVPMSAQTPTEYTIGIIDAGDKDPWFIDRTSVQYLYGGALKTASWDRVQDSNVGIIKITCSSTAFGIVAGDIGYDITTGAGDSGTLLDVNTATYEVWIRPDSFAAANNFDSSDTLTCNAHTATFTYSGTSPFNPVSNGESLWANIYSIGTIETNTHIYIYQNAANLVHYKPSLSTTDWWSDGHIDILVNVKELGIETDEGYITVLARQYSKTYSYYIVDLTNGGRNPIPLQTGNDLDNQTGFWQMDLAVSSGTFVDGEVIRDDSDSTIQGVVTSWEGTEKIIEYYLIGDPITNFGAGTGAFTGLTSLATGTAVAPTAVGPSNLSPAPTIRHGASATRLSSSDGGDFDVDENGTLENYSIVIDCQDTHSLAIMYGWSKYINRRGATTSTETDGVQGQFYIGSDYRITYTGSVTGTLDDADVATQEVTGATGTIVYHNITDKIIILRNSRGTFVKETVPGNRTLSTPSGSVEVDQEPAAITPIAAAPFGTFAGGKWFCAPGVVLDNYLSADLNNFQLTDDTGTVRVAPTKVNVTVGNTKLGDKIAVFRLDVEGGDIEKDRYSVNADAAIGDTSIVVTPAITVDEPGKSAPGGVLRVVDVSGLKEYRIRFLSWSGSTFTLDSINIAAADAATTTTIQETNAFTNSKVGDLVLNVTQGNAVSYITAVTDASNVVISPAITGQTTGDNIKLNVVPVALVDGTPGPADTVYVPFIDAYETADGSETVQVVYDATVYTRVRARRSGALSNRIIPFEQDSSIGTNGMSVSVIRTPDTIVT